MVISLCARLYAKRIFPRNSNVVFLMKKGEFLKKRGNTEKKGQTVYPVSSSRLTDETVSCRALTKSSMFRLVFLAHATGCLRNHCRRFAKLATLAMAWHCCVQANIRVIRGGENISFDFDFDRSKHAQRTALLASESTYSE